MSYKKAYHSYEENRANTLRSLKRWGLAAVIAVGGFLGWMWFDGTIYFDFETEVVTGDVTEVNIIPVKGNGYILGVHYMYSFEDESYNGIDQVGAKLGMIQVGEELDIQVLKRRPKMSNIKYP